MAQLERTKRSSDCPQPQTSPTFEQLLRVEEAQYWSISTSPGFAMNHDEEEYSSPINNKKSVLTKVKEKAKKLKHTLSGRKKHENEMSDDNGTPSCGVTLAEEEDDDDEYEQLDEDPEYLGAPMYESEAAPEILKETARQHPRADPVVSEKHLVPNKMKNTNATMMPSSTMTGAVSEKLGPAYAAVSDATHKIASKIAAGLTITTPEPSQETSAAAANNIIQCGTNYETKKNSSSGNLSSPQTWDKGVSVKEYFMNKLEPGEDERALSQAITDAISPRKTTTQDNNNKNNNSSSSSSSTGMVEKVKEAVTSLFRHEDPSNSTLSGSAVPSTNINAHSSKVVYCATPNSNASQDFEEENHGKILQPN